MTGVVLPGWAYSSERENGPPAHQMCAKTLAGTILNQKKLRELPYFLRNTVVLRFWRQGLHLQFPGNGERAHEMIIAHFDKNPACFKGNRIQNAGDSSYIVNCLNTALCAKCAPISECVLSPCGFLKRSKL